MRPRFLGLAGSVSYDKRIGQPVQYTKLINYRDLCIYLIDKRADDTVTFGSSVNRRMHRNEKVITPNSRVIVPYRNVGSTLALANRPLLEPTL